MPSLGAPEIMVILVVALLVFGPKRLPEVGRQVAKGFRELRRVQDSIRDELDDVLRLDEAPERTDPAPPAEAAAPVGPPPVGAAPSGASGSRPSRFRPPTPGARPPAAPRPDRRAEAAGSRPPARHRPPIGGGTPRGDAEA